MLLQQDNCPLRLMWNVAKLNLKLAHVQNFSSKNANLGLRIPFSRKFTDKMEFLSKNNLFS